MVNDDDNTHTKKEESFRFGSLEKERSSSGRCRRCRDITLMMTTDHKE